ncbi:hypothetical protein [Sutterella sp.]|uniref:hypothetical protein n=1 Tax=Sutterella sp. TaxID=1981025 RepID=UPI0026E042F4|nr:hypothetical protein [Sutterella sp.]MDO5532579.1 hypothetical protein [Sutterella sp.]
MAETLLHYVARRTASKCGIYMTPFDRDAVEDQCWYLTQAQRYELITAFWMTAPAKREYDDYLSWLWQEVEAIVSSEGLLKAEVRHWYDYYQSQVKDPDYWLDIDDNEPKLTGEAREKAKAEMLAEADRCISLAHENYSDIVCKEAA